MHGDLRVYEINGKYVRMVEIARYSPKHIEIQTGHKYRYLGKANSMANWLVYQDEFDKTYFIVK